MYDKALVSIQDETGRCSTLEIQEDQVVTIGVIPHRSKWKPKTQEDRDKLVDWLSELNYGDIKPSVKEPLNSRSVEERIQSIRDDIGNLHEELVQEHRTAWINDIPCLEASLSPNIYEMTVDFKIGAADAR